MYRGLDSFRALAFLAVFAFHSHLLSVGYLGVQAFFVLSGFLLTPILVDMKEQLNRRSFFVNFYGRRFLRIFPLYYLYVIVVLIICIILASSKDYSHIENVNLFLKQLPWTLTYTYDFFHATSSWQPTSFVAHFWSLAVEEQFYFVWPALIWVVNKKYLKNFLLTTIFIGPGLRLLCAAIYKSGELPFLVHPIDLFIYVLPFTYVDAFAFGGYFALYQKSDKTNLPTIGMLYLAILLGYLAQYRASGQVDFLSFGYSEFMKDQFIFGYSIINLVFAKTLIQIKDGKFFPLLMDNPFLSYLGKISYGLYVFHNPLIWLIFFINPSLSRFTIAFISILLTIGISSLVYELYEKNFLRLKDRYFPKNLSTQPVPVGRD